MNKDRVTPFFITAGVHFIFLVALSIYSFNVSLIKPTVKHHKEDTIEVGQQLEHEPAMNENGMPEDAVDELPEVKNDLWEEMDVETPPKQTADLNPLAPKPPQDLSNNNMYGKELEASSPNNRYRRKGQDGIFGEVNNGLSGRKDGPKEFFGVPPKGKMVFVFDISHSMKDYINSLKEETIDMINNLTVSEQFDCFAYNTDIYKNFARMQLWGEVRTATESNKTEAIHWIMSLEPFGFTPTYKALKYVCDNYPIDIDKIFLVTDGYPSNGWPTVEGRTRNIIPDAKKWWDKFIRCKLICISIEGGGSMFTKELAAAVNGSHILVE